MAGHKGRCLFDRRQVRCIVPIEWGWDSDDKKTRIFQRFFLGRKLAVRFLKGCVPCLPCHVNARLVAGHLFFIGVKTDDVIVFGKLDSQRQPHITQSDDSQF